MNKVKPFRLWLPLVWSIGLAIYAEVFFTIFSDKAPDWAGQAIYYIVLPIVFIVVVLYEEIRVKLDELRREVRHDDCL